MLPEKALTVYFLANSQDDLEDDELLLSIASLQQTFAHQYHLLLRIVFVELALDSTRHQDLGDDSDFHTVFSEPDEGSGKLSHDEIHSTSSALNTWFFDPDDDHEIEGIYEHCHILRGDNPNGHSRKIGHIDCSHIDNASISSKETLEKVSFHIFEVGDEIYSFEISDLQELLK